MSAKALTAPDHTVGGQLITNPCWFSQGKAAHTYGAEPGRVRCLAATFVASVSRYEDFLRAVSRPAPDDPPESAAIAAIAAANAITVLGPPGVRPPDAERARASLAA